MTTHATRQSSALQRTAPYLGVACLALLALASVQSVQGFAPEASSTTARGAAASAALSWLAAPIAPRPMIAAAAQWVGHASAVVAARTAFALAAAALLGMALALLAWRLRRAAARGRGWLAIPALLVAVALARAH